eukprot:SAG22_NODE_4150_length_1367_cov_1.282334_1_plen_66_part_00
MTLLKGFALRLALALCLVLVCAVAPHVQITGESPQSTFKADGPSYRHTDGEPDDQVRAFEAALGH